MAFREPRATARRPVLLAPVNTLLSRLPTSARLAALVALLLVPSAIANVAFATTISNQLNFSLTERDGVQVLRPALTAMATTVAGGTPDLAAVGKVVAAEPKLQLTQQWKAVQTAGDALTNASAEQVARAQGTLTRALADLVTETGNTSNLILDPDLDSFYVMDTLVVQVPRLLLTAVEAASPNLTVARTEQVAAQAVRAGTVTAATAAIISDRQTATDRTSDNRLAGRLTALGALADAGDALAKHLSSTLATPQAADASAVSSAAAAAVPSAATALDSLLATRTGKLAVQRQLTLAATLTALALASWFAAGVWWRTRRDVTLVLGAVTAIAEEDLNPREVPEGTEEFGRIGQALAVARHQLSEARAALTLSQAAREEQMQASFAQQRNAERQARERAQEVIDSTAGTVVSELNDVVSQVDAVRVAASTIDDRVAAADTAARSVVEQAHEADRLVSALAGSLDQVAGMTALIAGIADQTRLLALNATIESARAGEAGRGFSVVAQEVKNLAVTTARSTGQITETITSLQQDAEAVATAITMMGAGIHGVDEATEVLSNVATEQHALVENLDRCVGEAMARVNGMSALGEKLERRAYDRVPTLGTVELRHHGRVFEAALADISIGGLRCMAPHDQAPAVGDTVDLQIELADGPASGTARVARATRRQDAVQLGLEFTSISPATAERISAHVAGLAPQLQAPARK
jgi:methyl-accepting chemotaxis protein